MKDLFLRRRRRALAYRLIFGGQSGELVLADLRDFCRMREDSGPEPYALAMAEGRRQVFRRIQRFLNLDERALAALKDGGEHE